MTTVKLKGPEGHSGLSHKGVSYAPDKHGTVEVPHEAVAVAFNHGFTIAAEQSALVKGAGEGGADTKDLKKLNKAQLVEFAKATLGLDLDANKKNAELIAEIEAAQAKAAEATEQAEGAGEGGAA